MQRERRVVHRRISQRQLQTLRQSAASPFFLRLHDAYELDGRFHLVLEWMSAGSLDQHLRRLSPTKPMPPVVLCGITYQLLQGLSHLHG